MLKELNRFIQQYEYATNTQDFNQVRPLIKEDAVYFFTDGTFRGIEEIEGAFCKTWSQIHEEIFRITDVEWLGYSQTMAICVYQFYWKGKWKGEWREGRGRGTNTLVKEDGEWKMIHEHLSPLTAEPEEVIV